MTRAETAQEQVLRELRTLIAAGRLAPGQQVVQDALAAQLGVSRVPLREALKVLEGEGQVVYHPHRGYFVADLSVEDLVEVYRIRELLEHEALSTAVPLLTVGDIEHLEDLAASVEAAARTGDVTAVTAANRAFHFAMFDASGMPRLARLIRTLWDATDAYRSVYMSTPANLEVMTREHRQMLRAIAERDAAALVALQSEHRENTVSEVGRAISRPS